MTLRQTNAKRVAIALLCVAIIAASALIIGVSPGAAQDQINYISQPDELTVFLNDVVFVRDDLRVPVNTETLIVLPAQTVENTLSLRDESGRLPLYSINRLSGQVVLTIRGDEETEASAEVRVLTLEYITVGGINWQPLYDMHLSSDTVETVGFDFFAAINNSAFTLDETQVNLVAGRVDIGGQIPVAGFTNMNQGFGDFAATQTAPAFLPTPLPSATPSPVANVTPTPSAGGGTSVTPVTSSVVTQSVYRLPPLTAEPGETLYVEVLETTFDARQVLSWNASTNIQANVIYKIRNTSDVPLTEGVVRSYQDGIFLGSDEIEFTPPGSEGSVTVGPLREVRVLREITQVAVPAENPNDEDGTEFLREITLTLTSLSGQAREVEVVDVYPSLASNFEFIGGEPERQGGNVLRWMVVVPAGEEIKLVYKYRVPN